MEKQKLGISAGNHYSVYTTEIIEIIKDTGFDAISPEWETNADLAAISDTAAECGMKLQSLHAPYGGSAKMWSKDKNISEPALAELFAALDDCHRYNIPILVVHT